MVCGNCVRSVVFADWVDVDRVLMLVILMGVNVLRQLCSGPGVRSPVVCLCEQSMCFTVGFANRVNDRVLMNWPAGELVF